MADNMEGDEEIDSFNTSMLKSSSNSLVRLAHSKEIVRSPVPTSRKVYSILSKRPDSGHMRTKRHKTVPNLLENSLVAHLKQSSISAKRNKDLHGNNGQRTYAWWTGRSSSKRSSSAPATSGSNLETRHSGRLDNRASKEGEHLALQPTVQKPIQNHDHKDDDLPRMDLTGVDLPREDHGCQDDHTRKGPNLSRVQEALEMVRTYRQQMMHDRAAGVPQHWGSAGAPMIFVQEERCRRKGWTNNNYQGHSSKVVAEPHDIQKRKRQMRDKMLFSLIPGPYKFPKEKDFIPRDNFKVHNSGLDWFKMNKPQETPGDTVLTKSTLPGKLCRNPYPLTEAMHREGTSVTMLKGNILHPGDVGVAKVWLRKTDQFRHPVHMANEDIILSHRQRQNLARKASLAQTKSKYKNHVSLRSQGPALLESHA